MPDNTQDALSQFSAALAERVAAARGLVAGIRMRGHSLRSGTLWRKDVVVASEQALPKAEEAEVALADGGSFAARVAGRDPGTNVAVLRLDGAPEPAPLAAEEPRPGALVLALAADGVGGVAVRLGAVHSVGPAWHSRAGGRIDRRIGLDLRLERGEEGGPVLDAAGGLARHLDSRPAPAGSGHPGGDGRARDGTAADDRPDRARLARRGSAAGTRARGAA